MGYQYPILPSRMPENKGEFFSRWADVRMLFKRGCERARVRVEQSDSVYSVYFVYIYTQPRFIGLPKHTSLYTFYWMYTNPPAPDPITQTTSPKFIPPCV